MNSRRTPSFRREVIPAVMLLLLALAAVVLSAGNDSPALHSILDTGVFLLSAMIAFLLWDMGWRTGQLLARLEAVCFAVVALLELLHVITALDFSEAPRFAVLLRLGTWSPAAYLLPLGLLLALPMSRRNLGEFAFGSSMLVIAGTLMLLFAVVPRYSSPAILGMARPTLALVPLLWALVSVAYWRLRDQHRLARVFAAFAAITLFVPLLMLFSQGPADKVAITTHLIRIVGELYLLVTLIQVGTEDTAQRMRVEEELKLGFEALEARVAERTRELEARNADLRHEAEVREEAEQRTRVQVERLELLRNITRAIAERQDLHDIFQVVVRNLEEHLPVDFAAVLDYQETGRKLTVSRVGPRSGSLASTLDMGVGQPVDVDDSAFFRFEAGQLVYEPDVAGLRYQFPQRLAGAGLRSLVIVPLLVDDRSGVFGVLVVARRSALAFTSGDCEFLRQLCDHVSLAVNQAQLHESLKKAYEDLKASQNAVMQQERLRALGQMASGIAHDINNAISPVALYVETLLTHESGFSERARKQLAIIQRSVDDVAHTVSRMGEFYRQRPAETQLAPVDVNGVLADVLEITRARWSDMAQRRGAVIETRVENQGDSPVILGIEAEIREALINLVLNATDAMPDGGKLTLSSGHVSEPVHDAGRQVFIEVADTGSGMDEATRRRCLEPFFTTKGERGSGLGLAMVYGITQRHGIDIDIRSEPGKGTRFRLLFPMTACAPHSSGTLRIPKLPSNCRILLIDDDALLLTSLCEVLMNEGHEVQTAAGGRAGIDTFLEAHSAGRPYPVVITDLGMPHVDGRAVAAAIFAAAPATVIIMLTGWGQRLIASGDIPTGVTAVINKPPKLAELRRLLAEHSAVKSP
jgi:signal transduction histidine kinase/ActR/RegA family two-component response regulator